MSDKTVSDKTAKKERFILPPHPNPHMRIRREDLPTYEAMDKYVAQRKFNGTHVVLWVYEDRVGIWDRRGIKLTYYKIGPGMIKCLLGLNRDPSKELVMAGEVLHTKAKSKVTGKQEAENTICLFDVIMYGDYLTKQTQVERLAMLADLCRNPKELEEPKFPGATRRALVVDRKEEATLWLAEVFKDEFQYHYDECCTDQFDKHNRDRYEEIEGLVLRQKESRIRIGSTGGVGDVDWLIRCRKPKPKMYKF